MVSVIFAPPSRVALRDDREIRSGETETDYQYTGQRNEEEIGLYYYVARYYDPSLGRFIQADSMVPNPGNSKSYDRYAYVLNNPINATDPSGHFFKECNDNYGRGCTVVKRGSTPYNATSVKTNQDSQEGVIPDIYITSYIPKLQWLILQYGRNASVSSFSEVSDSSLPVDIENPILVFGIPIVVGFNSGVGLRTQNGKTYPSFSSIFNGGFGVPKNSVGIVVGTNNGIYGELEDHGVQLGYPDSFVYGPKGSVGFSTHVYDTIWVLTTNETIKDSGGIEEFGRQYYPNYSSYEIYDSDPSEFSILIRWNNSMGQMYELQERP